MLKIDLLKEIILVSSVLGIITCAFIQKIKIHFKCSRHLPIFSFLLNMIIGIVFCITFTKIKFPVSLWVGLFAFIGADSLYKTLEGKLSSYTQIVTRNNTMIPNKNIINRGEKND